MSPISPPSLIISIAALSLACNSAMGPATATLESVTPAPGAAVPVSSTITLRFGQPMMDGMEQYIDLHQGAVSGPLVPMTCGWNSERMVLTCVPGQLMSGTRYTIHIGGGMEDAAGEEMDLSPWGSRGGHWLTGEMMGGTHAGQPLMMLGPGWKHMSHYGMEFDFTTS